VSSFQWFCLALRIIGAWNLVLGLEHFTTCFNASHGFYNPTVTQPFGFFLQGAVHTVVALGFFRFAPFLALFAYPKSLRTPDAPTDSGAAGA